MFYEKTPNKTHKYTFKHRQQVKTSLFSVLYDKFVVACAHAIIIHFMTSGQWTTCGKPIDDDQPIYDQKPSAR